LPSAYIPPAAFIFKDGKYLRQKSRSSAKEKTTDLPRGSDGNGDMPPKNQGGDKIFGYLTFR
jgi:hypothetical protein